MSTRRFIFEGFLPADKKLRREVISSFLRETRTIILYEAPHRLKTMLEELYKTLGDRNIAVVRELTKKYEQVKKGTLAEVLEYYTLNEPKGEFVILLEGVSEELVKQEDIKSWEQLSIEEHMEVYIKQGMADKEAMKQVAKDRGVSKRDIYAYLEKSKEAIN
jgi:16S rRNA (cytidine1402-2'-O)-methyltransferase